MSRLTDLLEKAHTAAPGIGFAASRQAAATPSLALIGRITATELRDSPGAADSPADALLVTLDPSDGASLGRVGEALKGRLWGARVGSASSDDARALKEAGCDFIVFDAEGTSASLLNDDELGRVIAVGFDEPEFDEDEAKAVRSLDIDCALLSPAEGLLPLTVQKLLGIQKMRGLVRKRAILNIPADTGKSELETLRNAGISAVAVSLAGSADQAQRFKDDIATLPRRRPQSSRGSSTPSVDFGGGSSPDHDDDD